jgi:putative hemin transport protein
MTAMPDADDLLARAAALQKGSRPLRMRDAAEALGVPEAALLEARRPGGSVVRLRAPFADILRRMPEAGDVLAITRNDACVIESRGTFPVPEIEGTMGQTVGAIDLRLFLRNWTYAYAYREEPESGPRTGLLFFDAAGTAVHKIYGPTFALAGIVADFAEPDAAPADFSAAAFVPIPDAAGERPDGEIDRAGLVAAWGALRHTHEFFGLLRRFGVSRLQAMRLAEPDFARPVPASSARIILEAVKGGALPVMVFVGNPGCVQIHSGPVDRVEVTGPWLNVLDPTFNLHLREDRIAAAWVVRKPSVNGDIHSLELYDAKAHNFCQIFGQRLAGQTEREDWRALVAGIGLGCR